MKRTKKKTKKRLKGGGKENGERRYPVGNLAAYDTAYDRAETESPILNADKRARSVSHSNVLLNLAGTLAELIGNPEAASPENREYYRRGDQLTMALIPVHENELIELWKRFRLWAKLQVMNGHALEPPTEWPQELFELRLKREALLDVRRKEAFIIKKLIAKKTAEIEAERKAAILPCGAIGQQDGTTAYEQETNPAFDGQRISYTAKGVPFIDEPASPYHLMPLFWYKKMSAEWVAEYRKKVLADWEKIEGKGYKNKKTGKLISSLAYAGWKRPENWQVPKSDFPDWPEEAMPVEENR